MLPEEMKPAYTPLLQEGTEEETWQLVKAADKLAAYLKCLEELEAGNGEFGNAAQETLAALHRMELPEVSYFLEQFAGAFGLTLDELQRAGQEE